MKSFLSFCFLLAFTGLMLIGCSDKSISPIETAGVNDNPVVLQKGSTDRGAWIIEGESYHGHWWYDYETGLVLFMSSDDPWLRCSEGGNAEMIEYKYLYLPNKNDDLRRILWSEQGKDHTAWIWKPVPFPTEFTTFCDFLATAGEPMAVGTANINLSDKDYYGYLYQNVNVWSDKVNGTLYDSDGLKYNLNLKCNVWWGFDNDGEFKYNEVWKMQLTPTGK